MTEQEILMTGLPLNVDWQQILLHLLNFTILFGLLYILLYKPVKDFMEGREAHFAELDSKTEQALADAEASKETYESKLKSFDEEMKIKRGEAGKEIEAEREKKLAAAKVEADKIIADARAAADKEKADIIKSAKKEVTGLVTEAVEKITLETASEAYDRFLDAAEENIK